MDAKLFKAFTPYLNQSDRPPSDLGYFNGLGRYEATDPTGSQWRTLGFLPITGDDDFVIDIQGAGFLSCLQINERNLPGAVLREKVLERVLDIQARQGRKAGKKEIAEIKDDVALELLPKAFIKRKLVPVMFLSNGMVLVFSSSTKVCDDTMSMLVRAMDDESFSPGLLSNMVQKNIDSELTMLARTGQSELDDDAGYPIDWLGITTVGTLKGPNKQTISVKDKDMASHDMQELLKQDYTVTKLGLNHFLASQSTDEDSSFILSDHLVFGRFQIPTAGKVAAKDKKDADETFMATAWLTALAARSAVNTVIAVMGGLRAVEKVTPAEPASMSKEVARVTLDDDEL